MFLPNVKGHTRQRAGFGEKVLPPSLIHDKRTVSPTKVVLDYNDLEMSPGLAKGRPFGLFSLKYLLQQ